MARQIKQLVGSGIVVIVLVSATLPDSRSQTSVRNQSEKGDQAITLFSGYVYPTFQKYCLSCHNGEVKQSGLDLSTPAGLLRGGGRGPAVVPGDPQKSLLFKVVAHQGGPEMPYKGEKLPEATIAKIAEWIKAGAPHDDSSAAVSDSDHGRFEDVRGVLEIQCLKCHGGKLRSSGLDLSTREGLLRGGDNGPAVIAGNPTASPLYKRIKHELQPGMPFKGSPLPDAVIARFAAWISAGTPYEGPLQLADAANASSPGQSHWAFRAPKRPAIPKVQNLQWVRNPIDAFIAAAHERHGLQPLPPADKRVLLRRVYLDLIGLPPTAEEVRAFLDDRSANAYEKIVDRLLASPQYGERWGRHWMDIWRYSDSNGLATTFVRSHPHIWHWRDWIIESLNEDKGYDRMITEMLAGDEIAPSDPKVVRGTGYLVRSWYRYNRNSWLQETVDHTALAFLGITLKCARCHDHKYNPISQEEYYRFRAFFERYDVRADRLPGQPDLSRDSLPRVYDAEPRGATAVTPAIFSATYRLVRGEESNPDTTRPLTPGIPQIFGNTPLQILPVTLLSEAFNPDMRPFVHQDLLAQAREEIAVQEAALVRAKQTLAAVRQEPRNLSAEQATTYSDLISRSPTAATFDKEIKPILETSCLSCHNSEALLGGLALESIGLMLQGSLGNGPSIIPRNSRESPLILLLRGAVKPRMPLGAAPLPEAQIAKIQKWIDEFPQAPPGMRFEKAEAAVTLAEKRLAAAKAALPALQARIGADQAKFAVPPNPQAEELAAAARKAEQEAKLLKAEEDVLLAQLQLADAADPNRLKDEPVRVRKIAEAKRQLQAALAALGKSSDNYTPVARPYPATSTGRRSALARWIAGKDNPLTARVAINHMWMRHFGKPLVGTVADFGMSGKPPVNPDLLDWLAVEFMAKNWSMKAIHRLMVTSNTYRMRSVITGSEHPNLAVDAENKYMWRMNARRMEAEVVRDSVLYVAGGLDTTIGGPSVDGDDREESRRRSMYLWQTEESQSEFLKQFDAANPTECYERVESIIPQQALALTNSTLTLDQSRRLARTLTERVGQGTTEAFLAAAFAAILDRPPSTQELTKSSQFVREQAELFSRPEKLTLFSSGPSAKAPPAKEPELRARENLVQVLFNHNDFVTIH